MSAMLFDESGSALTLVELPAPSPGDPQVLARVEEAKERAQTISYGLEQANEAMEDLRAGRLLGAAALVSQALVSVWAVY